MYRFLCLHCTEWKNIFNKEDTNLILIFLQSQIYVSRITLQNASHNFLTFVALGKEQKVSS
jgi:hypothetical protein